MLNFAFDSDFIFHLWRYYEAYVFILKKRYDLRNKKQGCNFSTYLDIRKKIHSVSITTRSSSDEEILDNNHCDKEEFKQFFKNSINDFLNFYQLSKLIWRKSLKQHVIYRLLTQAFSLILAQLYSQQQAHAIIQHTDGSLYWAIGESVQTRKHFSIKNVSKVKLKNQNLTSNWREKQIARENENWDSELMFVSFISSWNTSHIRYVIRVSLHRTPSIYCT